MPAIDRAKLPFDEQIRFFRSKLGNLIPTERWTDVWKSQHDRGFMVAGAAKADLLADLARAVDGAIAEGKSIGWFRQQFDEIVGRHGWAYTGERNWRTRVIYQTNLSTSYAAGRLAQLRDPELQKLKPYWMYKHNDSVLHPRPLHQSWDGLTLPADHPWFKAHYPPNGWGCFPGDTKVQGNFEIGLKAWYAGEVLELETRGGHRVTLTPNHPVLTGRGWVRADEVAEGDTVFSQPGRIDGAAIAEEDQQHGIATAEQVFDALRAEGLRREQVLPGDFYGDGRFMEGDIDIVGAHRFLAGDGDTALFQFTGQFPGDRTHVDGGPLFASRGSAGETFDPQMSTFHARTSPRGIALGKEDSFLPEPPQDGEFGNAEMLGDAGRANAAPVHADDLPPVFGEGVAGAGGSPSRAHLPLNQRRVAPHILPPRFAGGGFAANEDAMLDHESGNRPSAHPQFARELLDTLPIEVTGDEIIAIRKLDFCGHVYDFQSGNGLIVTNGIVVSNCKCYVIAVSRTEAERLGGRLTAPPDDGINPNTGEPNGIDKGWGYMPGDTVVDDIRRQIEDKLQSLPPPLAQALRTDITTSPSAALEEALAKIEEEIATAPVEHTAVLDAMGNVLLRKQGDAYRVGFTRDEQSQLKDAVVTHSHPVVSSFSLADIRMLIKHDIAEMRAVDAEYAYSAVRPPEGWATEEKAALLKAMEDIEAAVMGEFMDKLVRGNITEAQFEAEVYHEVWLRVTAMTKLIYSRKLR